MPTSDSLVSWRSVPWECLADTEETIRLPGDLRRRAEGFFQEDFSDVSVHICRGLVGLGCRAAACGDRLYFAPGEYNPNTSLGCRRVFHELAHTVQQRRGRVVTPCAASPILLHDAALEAEADQLAALVESFTTGPLAEGPTGRRINSSTHVLQPVLTVGIDAHNRGGRVFTTRADADGIWRTLLALNLIPVHVRDDCQAKLRHWVTAPTSRLIPGLKGQNKQYANYQDLARTLVGRCSDAEAKIHERILAERVNESGRIRGRVWTFIHELRRTWHAHWMRYDVRRRVLERQGRYAYFYSSGLGIIKRNINEAINYFEGERDASIAKMAPFLCDYALATRDFWNPGNRSPLNIPNHGARLNHFNVNESNDWILRARQAQVRLGAGPSATTAQVVGLVDYVIESMHPGETWSETLIFIGLALFAFWNLKRAQLEMSSEIHTYHEVMLILAGRGIPVIPALRGRGGSLAVAEFEYPNVEDIPP